MKSKRWTFVTGLAALALVLAACAPATVTAPTSAPTTPPTTAPATSTTAASPAAPATVAPATATVAPATSPTPSDTSVPAASATPVAATAMPAGPAIAHLQAGQVITITSLHMLDANTGWATGGLDNTGDHVLTTADGGATWHDVTPPQTAPSPDQGQPSAAALMATTATTAWAVYGSFQTAAPANAIVWRTSDGGQSWQASAAIDLASTGAADFFQPSDITFLADGQTGWFLAHLGVGMSHDYFTIMKTTDGGVTWTHLIDPTSDGPQSCQKTGLHFADAMNGWLTGDCNGVAPGVFFKKTADGGVTWNDVTLTAPAANTDLFTRTDAGCGTYALHFFDAQNAKMSVACLILGPNTITNTDFIYSSADGGQSWTGSPEPARNLSYLDAQTIWAMPMNEGTGQAPFAISRTTDGGQTWTAVKQVAWTGQLDFVDATTGWAVAQADQAISLVKTTDGGKTWKVVTTKVG